MPSLWTLKDGCIPDEIIFADSLPRRPRIRVAIVQNTGVKDPFKESFEVVAVGLPQNYISSQPGKIKEHGNKHSLP